MLHARHALHGLRRWRLTRAMSSFEHISIIICVTDAQTINTHTLYAILLSTIDSGCANGDAIAYYISSIIVRCDYFHSSSCAHRSSSESNTILPFSLSYTHLTSHIHTVIVIIFSSTYFIIIFILVARSFVRSFAHSFNRCSCLFTLERAAFLLCFSCFSLVAVAVAADVLFSVWAMFIRAAIGTIHKQLVVCRYCIRYGILCMAVILKQNINSL